MNLEDIGTGDEALLCKTELTTCCKPSHTETALGNWFYPNGTRLPSEQNKGDFYRDRGTMVVLMHRRGGGEDGIYCCEIPDSIGVLQTIYIGVYNTSTGENIVHFYCL